MADESLSRRIAAALLNALKSEGHILIARGGVDAVVRELDLILVTPLPRIVARASRGFISGEVTSTFGDEATDEAVEEMVAEIREAVVESEHVEDVFAEDRELERFIFRVLREELLEAARSDDAAEDEPVPISVRLDTLGYVAATAAQRADESTLRSALDRAARQADGELSNFDPLSRLALFAMSGEDPEDRRLEVEEAVAEELTGLVTGGLVVLPTVERKIPLGRELPAEAWRALRPRVDMVAKRLLVATGVPSSWRPEGADSIRLSFTPLSEKDSELIDEIAAAFQKDVRGLLTREAPVQAPPVEREPAPKSARGGPPTRRSAIAEEPAPQPSGPDSAGPQSSRPKSAATQSSGTKSSGTQSSGTKSSGTQSSGTQSSGTQSSGTQSSGTQSSGTQSSGTKSAGPKSTAPTSKRGSAPPASKRPSTKPKPTGSEPPAKEASKAKSPGTKLGKTTQTSAKVEKAPTSKRR